MNILLSAIAAVLIVAGLAGAIWYLPWRWSRGQIIWPGCFEARRLTPTSLQSRVEQHRRSENKCAHR
jgi:hypothetical protein